MQKTSEKQRRIMTPVLSALWAAAFLSGASDAGAVDIRIRENPTLAAEDIAAAMDIPKEQVQSATAGFSPIRGKGVAIGDLADFPTRSRTFAILSTGRVIDASAPNDSESTGIKLGRLNNPDGDDLIELELNLMPPPGSTCVAFDYTFYSEEHPERIGLGFNDTFRATLGPAPSPALFETASVDTAMFLLAPGGTPLATGTTYDAGTSLRTARAALGPSDIAVARVVLSLEDRGDPFYDSAVFIDNLRFFASPDCVVSPPLPDRDGDGLPDEWETLGVDTDGDGTRDLDLQAMGADPEHKDVFLEIDYMGERERCRNGVCVLRRGHSHQPKQEALNRVIQAFAIAPVDNPDGTRGIRLHIDAGPNSIMNPVTWETWGERTRSQKLPHQERLGSLDSLSYNWAAFDQIKSTYFSAQRRAVFHYAVFAHFLGDSRRSGQSRGAPGSDFIVSLGAKRVGKVLQQAGTLMHELGHNLGLRDGGGDDIPNKPNYLSIMNPLFQTRGLFYLRKDGLLDYSFEKLASLDEQNLDENTGVTGNAVAGYETWHFCSRTGGRVKLNEPVDWDCDGLLESSVAADINRLGSLEVLDGYDDWENLVFDGGLINRLNQNVVLPLETQLDGVDFDEDDLLPTEIDLEVTGLSDVAQLAGTTQVYSFEILNSGEQDDTYTLQASSLLGWADATALPALLSLFPGQLATVSVAVTIPAGTPPNTQDEVTMTATSMANERRVDSATTAPYVPENPPIAHAGPDQRVECSSQNGTPVVLDGSGSQAPSGGELSYFWKGPFPEGGGQVEGVRPTVTLPLGVSKITLRVNDDIVDSYPDEVVVTVVDTTPPKISVSLSPVSLWPPNHQMWPITATVVATDICTPPTVALSTIASSEPDDAPGGGDGSTRNDIQEFALGTADFLFSLRAERSGSGPGRTYTARYTATDNSGNQAQDAKQVKVPHSQKK